MIVVEKRLEKIEAGFRKGLKSPAVKAEEAVLRHAAAHLDAGHPIRTLRLEPDEETIVRCFQFLTKKEALVILNSHEALYGKNESVLEDIRKRYGAVEFAGEFEMELAALDQESARAFMEDLGIAESARDRLTSLAYAALGYISFFTVGEDEVRAWNVRERPRRRGRRHDPYRPGEGVYRRRSAFLCGPDDPGSETAARTRVCSGSRAGPTWFRTATS